MHDAGDVIVARTARHRTAHDLPILDSLMTAPAPSLLLLGPVMLQGGTAAQPLGADRRAKLLARLAVEAGQWVERDAVATLFWPAHEPAEARRNLRKVVFNARALVGDAALQTTESALRWAGDTDLAALQRAIRERLLADAVALLRGPPLGGLDDAANPAWSDWLRDERVHILATWQQAAHTHLAGVPTPEEREALARRLLHLDALDEAAVHALIELQRNAGHLADARRTYRDYAARLADELGVEPSSALTSLLAAAPVTGAADVADVADVAPPPRAAAPDLSSRPAAGSFVGRRLDLQTLQHRLVDEGVRLLTITGPGGVGKSRLASQWLAGASGAFAAGRHRVELLDVTDGDLLPQCVAQSLGLVLPDAADPLQALAQALGAGPRLLVLDNAEHLGLLPATLDRWLDLCQGLSLLVTSRVRLGARQEQLLALSGLDVPDDFSRDIDAAATFDAVRLFEQRAATVQPGFSLQRHLPAVIDIVTAVAGLPLAIELAASWVRLLPPAEMADDLRDSIALLERDSAGADASARPEHVSMRFVLQRSLQLLAPREREALLGLAVFRGGFTAAAAREVAAVPLPLLSSLLDNSMLQLDADGRFSMHPLLAHEVLGRAQADPAALQAGRLRHAMYFARRLAALRDQHQTQPRALVQAFEAELGNGELAWQQAAAAGRHDLLRQALPAWRSYFVACGQFAHSVRHFESVQGTDVPPHLRAQLKAALAYFLIRHRRPERAVELAAEALKVAEQVDDTALAQECIAILGGARMTLGQWADAQAWVQRALALAQRLGAVRDVASAQGNLGLITALLGRFDDARGHFREAIALHHELGNPVGVARAMCNLGFVEVARGAWGDAVLPLHEARQFALAHGVRSVAPEADLLLGTARIELGELDAAEQHFNRCREDFRELGNAGFVLKCDYYLARIAARRGAAEEASRVMLRAFREAQAQAWVYDALYVAAFIAELLHARGYTAEAAGLLASVCKAPHADASVVAVVDACLAHAAPEDAPADGPATPFGLVGAALAQARDLDDAAARLRALSARP